MCRFAYIQSDQPIDVGTFLQSFSRNCVTSREFQGDGWGIAWWTEFGWHLHREIEPIWLRQTSHFPTSTRFLIHARSAFEQYRVSLPQNMPFASSHQAFAFNGELRGVRMRVPGSTGAAKIFHLLRQDHGDSGLDRARRVTKLLLQRTRQLRASNFVWTRQAETLICCLYRDQPEYFRLQYSQRPGLTLVASDALDHGPWSALKSDQMLRINPHGQLTHHPLSEEVSTCA